MKKILIILTLLILPLAASAHVLKTDRDIGVVMHVNPDDDPVVGEPASFYPEIKDKTGKFKAENCTCTATIMAGNTSVYSTGLFDSTTGFTNSQTYFTFTFPRRDVYKVVISGKPLDSSFQEFSVQFDLRVSRMPGEASTSAGVSTGSLVFMGLAIAVVVVGMVYFLSKRPNLTP